MSSIPDAALEAALIGNSARALSASYTARIIAFWLLHVPLGLLVRNSEFAATAHAYFVLGLALFFLLDANKKEPFVLAIAYFILAEPLWRLRVAANYEFVKYVAAVLLALAAVRHHHLLAANKKAVLYFLLLLPSIAVLPAFSRQSVSFNLSGPLVLAVALFYFSAATVGREQMKRLLHVGLAPLVAMAAAATYLTISAEEITFVQASNLIAAGGYGPNQVSAMLGLGAVLAFLAAVTFGEAPVLRLASFGLCAWLLIQSALTFSRGGLFTAVGTLFLATLLLLGERRARGALLVWAVVGFAGLLAVFPVLDAFTGGALSQRVRDTDSTGRFEGFLVDMQLFREHPLTGAGPGQADVEHARLFRVTRAHTEYSRVLAEHGLFGLAALIVLALIVLPPMLRPAPYLTRAYRLILTAWALVTLAHIATRLAAPALILGLSVSDLRLAEPARTLGSSRTAGSLGAGRDFASRLRLRYGIVRK